MRRSISAALLFAALGSLPAQARSGGYCRPKTSLPPGSYQKTCQCTVEHCDYLVCTCDGAVHSSFKITTCTSQSFSDINGMLACN